MIKVNISKDRFNPVYLSLLECDKRYIILYGGAGSGKSVFAAQRFIIRMLREKMCNILVVRKVFATHKDSTYALFRQIICKWGIEELFSFNKTQMCITCKNGNSALFKGLDDVEKLKSITFDSGELNEIWIEEASEISESDFNQLDIRLRGKNIKGQITLSFNPISIQHWLKRRFFDGSIKNAEILKTTYKDNEFLSDDYRDILENFKKADPYYYSVYCLGEWGVMGKTIFDAEALTDRLASIPTPLQKGDFTYSTCFDPIYNRVLIDDSSIKFIPCDIGGIKIYSFPEKHKSYIIGGDTAGEGSDWFCAQVIDASDGTQVCTLRQRYDEDLFADQVYCLGLFYNRALVAIEANFSSYPIKRLEQLLYPRQYVREKEDNFTHKTDLSYGFKTTSVTRPIIISGLVEAVRKKPEILNDRETILEMLSFIRNEAGRPEAESGAHDDCVMSLAIANYCTGGTQIYDKSSWTADMIKDYHNASYKDKKTLLKKWK